jgi:hypothetical protein
MILSGCDTCYEAKIDSCAETIMLDAGLEPSTDYIVIIKDKFNSTFKLAVTSGVDGKLEFNTSALPVGLLNPFAGAFTLTVQLAEECTDTELTLCETQYTCVAITVNDVVQGDRLANIPCCATT